MGRPRKNQSTRPPCYFESHGAWYLVKAGKWTRLPEVRSLADAHEHYAKTLRTPAAEHQLDALIDGVFTRMKNRKPDPLAAGTVEAYELAAKRLKHLLRKFSRPDQVKQKDAAMVKVLLANTPSLANRVMSFGRAIWADFLEHQLIDQNPFVGVKRHKTSARTRLYTWDEWHAIEAKAGPVLRLVMDGLYLTDQRIGDVLKLDERDLLDDGIYVKQKKGGKRGKELIIAWHDQLRDWVARCRAAHGVVVTLGADRARPLLRNRGRAIQYHTIAAQWRKACAAAGVEDGHMHDGRAFSATEAKRQGLDAQKLLGHTDASTTRIYLRGREIEVVQGPRKRRSA
jgi:integrase